jgi:hypothetical protein
MASASFLGLNKVLEICFVQLLKICWNVVLQKVGERKFEQNVQIKKLLHEVKDESNILTN